MVRIDDWWNIRQALANLVATPGAIPGGYQLEELVGVTADKITYTYYGVLQLLAIPSQGIVAPASPFVPFILQTGREVSTFGELLPAQAAATLAAAITTSLGNLTAGTLPPAPTANNLPGSGPGGVSTGI